MKILDLYQGNHSSEKSVHKLKMVYIFKLFKQPQLNGL